MDESHYKVMRLIEANPRISQLELAQVMGMSLGKANYCLSALIDKGWVKARNFRKSNNRLAYSHLLTPRGAQETAAITVRFPSSQDVRVAAPRDRATFAAGPPGAEGDIRS
jgi:EPS-associated MarR family transcriptional regulator